MSETTQAVQAARVQVWDLPVRLFHWLLVIMLVFQYVTFKASWMTWHMYGGYTILALILFRIIWGFVGSTHARFGDFLYGPGAIFGYLRTLPRREAAKFAGHNPLGGLSVLLMLLAILVQAVTGLFSNDDVMVEGPMTQWIAKELSDKLTSIHRYNFYVVLALAGVHILAVLYYLLYKSENLVKAMFTGYKTLPSAPAGGRIAGTGLALVVLAIAAAAVYFLVTWKWK
jgi:cytochrome b